MFQRRAFEVVVYQRGCAANSPECEPHYDEFGMVDEVDCHELAWSDALREQSMRILHNEGLVLGPGVDSLQGPDTC